MPAIYDARRARSRLPALSTLGGGVAVGGRRLIVRHARETVGAISALAARRPCARGMMRSFRRIVLETGIAGGLLFAIHASFPYVYSWPLIWPPLAGAAACWLATREPRPHRLRSGLAAALTSGVIIGAIAFVVISAVVYVVLHSDLFPSVRQSGAPQGLATAAGTLAAASLSAIAVALAFIGGVLMLPVRYVQTRRAHA